MSESVLKALMQLFAIVADVEGLNNNSRNTVKLFLQDEVSDTMVQKYLVFYDTFINEHHFRRVKKDGQVKRASRNSVKILRIAAEINQTLTRQQKLVVSIRLVEYIFGQNIRSQQNIEFLNSIADSFNIDGEEFNLIKQFAEYQHGQKEENDHFFIYGPNPEGDREIEHAGLSSHVVFVNLYSSRVIAFRLLGKQELYVSGSLIRPGKVYLFRQGASIRSSRISPIYHSDVLSKYTREILDTPVSFAVEDVEYHFSKGDVGLRSITFNANSGQMVGIMGGSGTGKSTLLNVLNGNYSPTYGDVRVNGIDIHDDSEKVEGLIGYVPQDDLLIEDLTVYQNLYYNAHLSFGNLQEEAIVKRVNDTLSALGLSDTRDLKVGSALEKTISGGQRKRVNIALELIREPSILFVDEPTSGLSSRDSENIMDLLKELTLKGKLVFCVIHQPSSEIFKMFDNLLILDQGGYLIYQGDPLDGISYFRDASGQINTEMGDCPSCGNVNPEQIFDIIEAKVVNEYGDLTDDRKTTPEAWHEMYRKKIERKLKREKSSLQLPKLDFSLPGIFKQLRVFTVRDLLSKVSNRQYIAVNLLEAPVLAVIIAGFLRYKDQLSGQEYIFRENENILAYIFISVVVAIFLGLSVSAEEIIRDRKIRKRESFLNLSKGGYLASKIVIQFGISAIQIFSYVAIGNFILGIKGMTMYYWIALFTAACFANILGLNVSASFRKVVTIYILIPFIIIPQILFSGVLVKYHELNPWFASKRGVPVIGNLMASRWAFEALVVKQVKENEFEKNYFHVNRALYHYNFMKNYWIPEIEASISAIENALIKGDRNRIIPYETSIIYNEFQELPEKELDHLETDRLTYLGTGSITINDIPALREFVDILDNYYGRMANKYTNQRDEITYSLKEKHGGEDGFMKLKAEHENEQLWEYVNNKNNLQKIMEIEGELFRIENRIYQAPEEGINHYYSSEKVLFGRMYSTYWFNITILWVFTFMLAIALYYDILPKTIALLSGDKRYESD